MKITSLEPLVVDIGPRNWLFVVVETDEGVNGVGEGSLPGHPRAVPDVTLEEVCAVRWDDEKLVHCPSEIEIEHAPYCLQVPNGYPTDPDLIGPFDT